VLTASDHQQQQQQQQQQQETRALTFLLTSALLCREVNFLYER